MGTQAMCPVEVHLDFFSRGRSARCHRPRDKRRRPLPGESSAAAGSGLIKRLTGSLKDCLNTRIRSLRLIVALVVAAPVAVLVSIYSLYLTAMQVERETLNDVVTSQVQLIEAVARFDARVDAEHGLHSRYDKNGARDATLGQVVEALQQYHAFGESGEFIIAEQSPQGEIIYLYRQRGAQPQARGTGPQTPGSDDPIRRALAGDAGSGIYEDYRGNTVLAAFQPVIGLNTALVAKKDLSEIREPFVRTGAIVMALALTLLGLAAAMTQRSLGKFFRRLDDREEIVAAVSRAAPGMLYRAVCGSPPRLEYVSDRSRRLLGWEPEALVGHELHREFVHPDDIERVQQALSSACARQEPYQLMYRIKGVDGRYRWVQDFGQAQRREGRLRAYGTLLDVQHTVEMEQANQRMISIFDNSTDIVGLCDADGVPQFINPAGRRMLGLKDDEDLANLHISKFSTPSSWRQIETQGLPEARNKGWWQGDLAFVACDGREVPVSQLILAHKDADGEVEYFSTVARDLSERYEMEGVVERQRTQFRNVVGRARLGIVVIDQGGCVKYANPAAESITGYSYEQLEGIDLGIPVGGDAVSEVQFTRPDGTSAVAEMNVTTTEWEGETAYLAMFNDVTQRRHAEEAINHMAYHDPVTNLANRSLMERRLIDAIGEFSAQRPEARIGVLFLDLDRFKDVNDSYGHSVGDALLQQFAQRLKDLVRDKDTVARFGGDEFVIVLTDIDDAQVAQHLSQRILSNMQKPFVIDGRSLLAECSIGVSIFPDDAEDAEQLISHADAAMYEAKQDGRNTAKLFSPEKNMQMTERMELHIGLREALDGRQFRVFYQPQVDLRSGVLVGMESLLRWEHPIRGIVSAAEFMPVLEETGLIERVGEWGCDEAFRQAAQWAKAGISMEVGINLSAFQLRGRSIADRVLESIEVAGLERGRAAVEITESAAVTDIAHTIAVLNKLRKAGVTVMLDDFGKGYSSLNYLRQLPVDVVKIDKAFVDDVPGDREAAGLVRAIIVMAHSLGKRVLAEGVETEEQREFLRREGCDLGQGYLFGRPCPPLEASALREMSAVFYDERTA